MSEESKLQGKIVKAIKKIDPGNIRVHAHVASAYTGRGHADIYGCRFGLYFEGEVKLPGKEPTRIQQENLKAVARAEGLSWVWTDVKQAVNCIKGIKRIEGNLCHAELSTLSNEPPQTNNEKQA